MKLEQYLEAVSEQIRYTKIRPSVTEELKNHILDQADAYVECGAMEDEALERAVREMGDPVETGAALDRIHRPKMSWDIIGLIGLLSLFSIGALCLLNLLSGTDMLPWQNQAFHILLGFAAMLVVCHIDYSILGKYGKPVTAVFLILMYLLFFTIAYEICGARRWISLFSFHVSLPELMFLYIPLYGTVLYSYRGKGWSILPKLILWILPPLLLLWNMPDLSSCCILFTCLFGMFAFAVTKDWYRIPKKAVLTGTIGGIILCPALFISCFYLFGESYQKLRIKAFFSRDTLHYIEVLGRQLLESSALFGKSNHALELLSQGSVREYQTDYILIAMCTVYGTIIATGIIALLLWMIFKIFHISVKQKSQLGMITGVGCGLVFLVKTVLGVLNNLQLIPYTSINIPFLSYGGTGIVVSYILLGLVLSVYRYKDILPDKKSDRARASAL